MLTFKMFFEKRIRNPLRKKELEDSGRTSNMDYVKSVENELPPEEIKKISKMVENGVDEESIEKFKNAKLAEYQKKLRSDYLRKKPDTKHKLIMNKWGIQVFRDSLADGDFSTNSYNYRMLNFSLRNLVKDYKDILPIRKAKVIITDLKKNPIAKGGDIQGTSAEVGGLYHDRKIYIDHYSLDQPELLIHEYAHFLADRVPKQYEPLIKKEYQGMLESYFEKKTKRKTLEGKRNEIHREEMAKRLGLPSVYSATNFDEFFAEVIMHWKNLPNNVHTYRFKTMMKKILTRV
jgi:hypothetical protein